CRTSASSSAIATTRPPRPSVSSLPWRAARLTASRSHFPHPTPQTKARQHHGRALAVTLKENSYQKVPEKPVCHAPAQWSTLLHRRSPRSSARVWRVRVTRGEQTPP